MNVNEKAIQTAVDVAARHNSSIIPNENVVYLMGTSFIIGSLFTILIFIFLDFMRRKKA